MNTPKKRNKALCKRIRRQPVRPKPKKVPRLVLLHILHKHQHRQHDRHRAHAHPQIGREMLRQRLLPAGIRHTHHSHATRHCRICVRHAILQKRHHQKREHHRQNSGLHMQRAEKPCQGLAHEQQKRALARLFHRQVQLADDQRRERLLQSVCRLYAHAHILGIIRPAGLTLDRASPTAERPSRLCHNQA